MDKFKVTNYIDKDKWSEFVYNHPKGNIFQTPEMYGVYERTKNYEPIFLAVVDKSDNIKAMLLAHVIREFKGFLGPFSTRSIIRGGPLYEENEEGATALKILMEHYDKIVRKKALYTEIRLMFDVPQLSILGENRYIHEGQLNFLIDLKRPPEMILGDFKRDKKRAVKKADKLGLDFKIADSINEVESFYEILLETYRRANIPLADETLFSVAFDQLHDKAKLFIAKINDDIIAGRFILCYRTTILDWYAGAKADALSFYPNEFLVWCVLKWGAENRDHVFDFGDAGNPNEEYGVREFKKQFGGQLVNFGRYKKIHSPRKLWLAEKGFEVWRRLKF